MAQFYLSLSALPRPLDPHTSSFDDELMYFM